MTCVIDSGANYVNTGTCYKLEELKNGGLGAFAFAFSFQTLKMLFGPTPTKAFQVKVSKDVRQQSYSVFSLLACAVPS